MKLIKNVIHKEIVAVNFDHIDISNIKLLLLITETVINFSNPLNKLKFI